MKRMIRVASALALVGSTCAAAGAESIGDVFDRVSRSVVVIRTLEREVAAGSDRQLMSVPGQGSGVIISADGKVLTAAHVVGAAEAIHVEFPGGRRILARIIASAPDADVSLLQLQQVPAAAVVAPVGDSDRVRVGDQVFIVGAPYGISHTLTVGYVSGRHQPGRVWDRFTLAEFLQTDAAINQGNSGGPMFSMAGEVIGVVSHNISRSGGSEGLGFVVTSNLALDLLKGRRARWWGFEGELITDDLLRVFNLPESGLLVQRVVANSPAETLGLRGGIARVTVLGRTLTVGGDFLLRVQGVPCGETHRVRDTLNKLKPGDRLSVTILREGQRRELTMTVP